MANIPTPKSFQEILGTMIDTVASDLGIRTFKQGAPTLSILEAASQSDFRQDQSTFQALESTALDNAEGPALDKIGADEGTARPRPSKALGTIQVTDQSFEEVKSNLNRAPPPGALTIAINDAYSNGSNFANTGQLYIGLGSPNLEGPLTYTAKANLGAHSTITLHPTTPTTKIHNVGELVVMAQGGQRTIDKGTVISTNQGSISTKVSYRTVKTITIPDGLTSAEGQAIALVNGVSGNVGANTINNFESQPFSGATVANALPFSGGTDLALDNDYRELIRNKRNTKQKGTDLAITSSILGASSVFGVDNSVEDPGTINSAAIVRQFDTASSTPTSAAIVYIDDGSGYEQKDVGIGFESIVTSALGGEVSFKTIFRPIAKPSLTSGNDSPFSILPYSTLCVNVGGKLSQHVFPLGGNGVFAPGVAVDVSAQALAADINANGSLLFSARTDGAKLVLFPRGLSQLDLQLIPFSDPSLDANLALQFDDTRRCATLLYQNDRLLSMDGKAASLSSLSFSQWQTFSGSQTVTLKIDQVNATTYTITDQDFVDAGTVFNAVGKNDLNCWQKVLTFKIPGVTTTIANGCLVLTSNRGKSSDAYLEVVSGSLVSNKVFAPSYSQGLANDYQLDRPTGTITLSHPLAAGDSLTLGSAWPRAFLESLDIPTFSLGTDGTFYLVSGTSGDKFVNVGVNATTPLTLQVTDSTIYGNKVKLTATSASEVFGNVLAGDWLIVNDKDASVVQLRGAYRITEVSSDKKSLYFEKKSMAAARYMSASSQLDSNRILVTGGWTTPGNFNANIFVREGKGCVNVGEIFNLTTKQWSYASNMSSPRAGHTQTLLNNGKILVTGGYYSDFGTTPLFSTEIYDPGTNSWSAGPTMDEARAFHSATLLVNGNVLIAGGFGFAGSSGTNKAQEYDPNTNTFVNSSTMATIRWGHQAVRMPNPSGSAGVESDNVLVIGGVTSPGTKTALVERYNYVAHTWAGRTGITQPKAFFGACVGPDGDIFVIGDNETSSAGTNAEQSFWLLYDATANAWASGSIANFYLASKNITKLANGDVLMLHGKDSSITPKHKAYTLASGFIDIPDSAFFNYGVEKTYTNYVAIGNKAIACGGLSRGAIKTTQSVSQTTANTEVYDRLANSWSYPDPVDGLALTLPNAGISVLRSNSQVQKVSLPSAVNYTAQTVVTSLNQRLEGMTAKSYQTEGLRISSNEVHGTVISLGNDFGFDLAKGLVSSEGLHYGASISKGYTVPESFQIYTLTHATSGHATDINTTTYADRSSTVVLPKNVSAVWQGLNRNYGGLGPSYKAFPPDYRRSEVGNNNSFRANVGSLSTSLGLLQIGLRTGPTSDLVAHQPFVLASPYAIGPNDSLGLQVDGAEGQAYSVPMSRLAKPVGSYGSQITIKDGDNANDYLAKAFGISYKWDDFLVYMAARAKSHSADATKSALWRYYRLGQEGENVVVRYQYPKAANSSIALNVVQDGYDRIHDNATQKVNIDIVLGSGAAKTGSVVRTSSKVGLARVNTGPGLGVFDLYAFLGFAVATGQRTSTVSATGNSLTLTIPDGNTTGPNTTGLQVGDVVWFQANVSSPTTLFSGPLTITQVDAISGTTQKIYFSGASLNDGSTTYGPTSNIGTISFDPTGETYWDTSVAVNDLLYLKPDVISGLNNYVGEAARVQAFGRQYLKLTAPDMLSVGPWTSIFWFAVTNTDFYSLYAGPSQSVSSVVSSVNALGGAISGTVLGTGLGIIQKASWDELGTVTSGYALTDGLNAVQSTINPINTTTDYQILLKSPVSSDLLSNSDWTNETVRLVPCLGKDLAKWLNTTAVTPLSNKAEITWTNNGIQIMSLTPGSTGSVWVQGGSANAATANVVGFAKLIDRPTITDSMVVSIPTGQAGGLVGGSYVTIKNSQGVPKTSFWSSINVNSIDANGTWTFDAQPWTPVANSQVVVSIEKVGEFVAIRVPFSINSLYLLAADGAEGQYIYLTPSTGLSTTLPGLSSGNLGVFKILRSTENAQECTFWIKNPSAIEETGQVKIVTLDENAPVPGDEWVVSTDYFGVNNKRTWIIAEVGSATLGGEQYVGTNNLFRMVAGPVTVQTLSLLVTTPIASLIQLRQGSGAELVKRVVTVSPNADPTLTDVTFDTSNGYGLVSAAAGSIINTIDKLGFSTVANNGVDGYKYAGGLIHEANKILYGSATDSVTYPGVVAAGAIVHLEGAPVRRITISLALRVVSGQANNNLADRVRNAVASVINQSPVGQPIQISAITGAADKVGGVLGSAVVSPKYDSAHDQIPIYPYERPKVLDLAQDILISFINT